MLRYWSRGLLSVLKEDSCWRLPDRFGQEVGIAKMDLLYLKTVAPRTGVELLDLRPARMYP